MYIQKATINELEVVAELFDLYRVFYEQTSDINAAKEFLNKRIVNEESVIFLALEGNVALGFVQLYPSFSSVSMKRSWVLNDLYVKKEARGQGVGENLIKTALHFAKESGAKGVFLETGKENVNAQRLYEKIGFVQETNYFYYYTV
ncbi:GNAT family N-acetyltransferase [Bacillus sp. 1P10SD]|uniref:GNAT family N-acetyltransferase n=1 Tax=Bacillus sp. 1P10SD TaxID=3132265 RepID=UPI0039A5AB8E